MSFKRILAMLLSALMIFSMLPVAAFAEEEPIEEEILDEVQEEQTEEEVSDDAQEEEIPDAGILDVSEPAEIITNEGCDPSVAVAKIVDGDVTTYYATLAEALAAVEDLTGTTVELTASTSADVSIASGKSIVLDLGGFTLTGSGASSVITNAGTLSIRNGTLTMPSGATNTANGGGINNSGTLSATDLTITGCTTNSTGNGGAVYNTGIFNMNSGCSFTSNSAKNGSGIYNATGGTINMNGGTVTSAVLIYKGTANIDGAVVAASLTNGSKHTGTINVTSGWFNAAVDSTVSGWTITDSKIATGACADAPNSSAPYTVVEAGSYTVTYNLDGNTTTVAATEGTLGADVTLSTPSGLAASDVFSGWYLNSGMTGTSLSGSVQFSESVTLYGHVESGASPVAKIGDTEYYTFDGADGAFTAANVAGSTSTITLLDDVTVTSALSTIVSGADITLDLGGKTFTCDATSTSARAFTVSGTLTIKNGTVYGPASTEKSGAVFFANKNSTINVVSGKYVNRGSTDIISRTTKVSGTDVAGDINVSGGWFSNAVGTNYLAEGYVSSGKCENATDSTVPYSVFPENTTYTISYVLDGDNTAVAASTGTCGAVPTLTQPTVETGDAFSGWYLNSDLSGDALSGDFYFAGDVTLYGHIEEGASPVAQINGTDVYTYNDIINAAAVAGDTSIVLCSDLDTTGRIDVVDGANVTIDLGGYTITAVSTSTKTDARVFNVLTGGSLTVKNGTVLGPTAMASNGTIFFTQLEGTLLVESGTYINRVTNGKTLTSRANKTDTQQAYTTITGGWFSEAIANYYFLEDCECVKVLSGVDAEHTFPADAPYTVAGPVATITYDANGGNTDSCPEAKTGVVCVPGYNIENPSAVKLSTKYPFCTDKVFLGWDTDKDATEPAYEAGSEALICTGDMTLYAIYRAATADDYIVTIGTTNYTTLAEALTVLSDGDTLTLAGDVVENLTITKNITLDLNGHKLSNASTGSALTIEEGVTAVIQDSSNPSEGLIYGEAQTTGGAIDNKGTLTIKGGSFRGFAPNYGAAVYNRGTLIIEGGTFSYEETVADRDETGCSSVVYSNGSAISVTITGGTFDGTVGKGSSNTVTEIEISGGKFTEDPSSYVDQDICNIEETGTDVTYYEVNKCEAVAKIGEKEYKTLDLALDAAVENDVVVCLADAESTRYVEEGVTLDLNGYKLLSFIPCVGTIKVYDADSLAITFENGGTTVIGGTDDMSTSYFTAPAGTVITRNYKDVSFVLPTDGVLTINGKITENVTVTGNVIIIAGSQLSHFVIDLEEDDYDTVEINGSVTLKALTADITSIYLYGRLNADSITSENDAVLKLDHSWSCVNLKSEPDNASTVISADFPYEVTPDPDGSEEAVYKYRYYNTCKYTLGEDASHAVSNVILEIGETYQFNYDDLELRWNSVIEWQSSDESVATVEAGLVTAVAEGTAYITAEGETYRVDVAAGDVGTEVQGVAVTSNKVTVELYKSEPVNMEILVKLPEMDAATAATGIHWGTDVYAEDAGVAIDDVQIADAKTGTLLDEIVATNLPFKVRVVDDRYIEITPNATVAKHIFDKDKGWSVKGSYKYKLAITVDGEVFTTEAITFAIKKSTPKIKASAITINSLAGYNTCGSTTFTGGNVTAVYTYDPKPTSDKINATPEWAELFSGSVYDNELAINYTGAENMKASGNVYLQCSVEGWNVTCPVTVKVNVVNKAPTVTLKATGTIESGLDTSEVRITTTVKNDGWHDIVLESIQYVGKASKATGSEDDVRDTWFNHDFDGSTLIINPNPDNRPAAGNYIVTLSYDFDNDDLCEREVEKTIKFTVKATAADKVKIKLTQSTKAEVLFKNDKNDYAEMTVAFNGNVPGNIDRVVLDAKMALLFDYDYNKETGVITVYWKDDAARASMKVNASKTLKFSFFVEGNTTTKANATVSLKITAR